MNRDEIYETLTALGIFEDDARYMIAKASDRGDSHTVAGIFITYDGSIYNIYT